MTLHKLNGTSASTADIRDVVAEVGTFSGMNGILLYLDEIQYFNKKQQQLLLEYMENGQITLIASTTENPYFAVYNALISRSTVFEFAGSAGGTGTCCCPWFPLYGTTAGRNNSPVRRCLRLDRTGLRRRCPQSHEHGGTDRAVR